MNRLKKSQSNPSKLSCYTKQIQEALLSGNSNRKGLLKSSSTSKLNKSLSSNSRKFGIRQLQHSPLNKNHRIKEQDDSRSKISINTLNMNLIIKEKVNSKIVSPLQINTLKTKGSKNYYSLNFFKANRTKAITKRNDSMTEQKKAKGTPFNFQPIKKLASGQYGGLYLAVEKETQMLVVLKAFNKSKVTLDFMIDEFKIQMFCEHPNILPGYGFFFGRTEVYLIMEAGSHNLYAEIKKAGYFSEKKAANYIGQVMKGLSSMHLNGVIHRDIKPENIIICGGALKISDFGWSAITNSDRETFCGTLDYLSPEVSHGVKYDSKIDSWSVGVLLYEMVSGYPPFAMSTTSKQTKPSLDYSTTVTYPSRISKECEAFIRRLLTMDPARRPTVTEMLRDPWLVQANHESKKMSNKLEGGEII